MSISILYQFLTRLISFMMKSRSLPRNVQISETLIREISAGILADGARLPTEKQMAKDYGVSVGTLRKSLATLEEKGLLERVQGSGNYICAQDDVLSVYSFFRLERLRGGGLPTAQILSITQDTMPHDCPLNTNNNRASRIIRFRYLDNILIALEEIWCVYKIALNREQANVSESLYEYYKTAMGLIISRREDKVSLKPLPNWTPHEFNMTAGDMAGYIERVAWDQFDQLTEFSKTWFHPKKCHYVNRA